MSSEGYSTHFTCWECGMKYASYTEALNGAEAGCPGCHSGKIEVILQSRDTNVNLGHRGWVWLQEQICHALDIPQTPSVDAYDILETLDITQINRRILGGSWVYGTLGGHRFKALVFPEHASHPEIELNDGRISKLRLERLSDRAVIANFNRGWDIRPQTPLGARIVEILVDCIADSVYE